MYTDVYTIYARAYVCAYTHTHTHPPTSKQAMGTTLMMVKREKKEKKFWPNMRISSRMLMAVRATDECSRMKANAREREKEREWKRKKPARKSEHEWVRVCENGLVRTGDREKECSLWIFLLNFQVWWLPSKQLINKHKHKWKNHPHHFSVLQTSKTQRVQDTAFVSFLSQLRFCFYRSSSRSRRYCHTDEVPK